MGVFLFYHTYWNFQLQLYYILFTNMFIVLFAVQETCDSETEGAIRLTQKSSRETIGRLEVCFDGYWGSVCGIGATDTIADIACRQLSYASGGMMCNYNIIYTDIYIYIYIILTPV